MSESPKYIDRMQQTAEIINEVITPERVFENLTALQPPAPSTAVLHTRTPIIRSLLIESGITLEQFTPTFLGSRSPAVLLGRERDGFWFSAHSDQPTYLPPPTNKTSFDLIPICAHRPKKTDQPFPEFPAAVLRYIPQHHIYEIVSNGVIGTNDKMTPYYIAGTKPRDGFRPGYDRVVYSPTLAFDEKTGLVSGNIDNAAGIAASIAAIQAIIQIAKSRGVTELADLGVKFIFPDEEEGLPEDPAYFAKEARRIGHRAAAQGVLPRNIVNVDDHDTVNDEKPMPVAVYGAYVSQGKGPVVPPDIYAKFDLFLRGLSVYGVAAQPTETVPASLSRSDDAGYMDVHDQIMPVGYLARDSHHNSGIATAHIIGLTNTAKAIAWIATEMFI